MGPCLKWKLILTLTTFSLLSKEVHCNHGRKSFPSHDLIVSIHQSIPEDKRIIHSLQKLLTEASRLFYQVTKNGTLSETITIVIPNAWTHPVSGSSNNVEDISDIRIENYHLATEKKDAIHTVQSGECGHHGNYITMTPEFLLHHKHVNTSAEKLAQQILRYKFGIFEDLNLRNELSTHVERLQGINCHGRSGWQVMRKELDNYRNSSKHKSLKLNKEFRAPHFKIVKAQPGNVYMFLVDGSIQLWNTTTLLPAMINALEDSAKMYIPVNNYIGLGIYSDNAKIVRNLTLTEPNTTFANLYEDLESEEKGVHRNLYHGFEECLEEIKRRELATLGARIVLITDSGWSIPHTESSQYAHKLTQQLKNNGVVLHTFALGTNLRHHHHQKLQEISHQTEGQFYVIQDEDYLRKHGLAMLATLIPENIVVISEDHIIKHENMSFEKKIYIESQMEADSQIHIDGNTSLNRVVLTNPKKELYLMQEYKKQLLICNTNQTGLWSLQFSKVNTTEDLKFRIQVVSRPEPMTSPVHLSAWMKQHHNSHEQYFIMKVFAQLKSVSKLHSVKVTAEIKGPSRNATHLKLKDTGVGADMVPGDGIYSDFFTNYNENGRYDIAVRVHGKHKEHKPSNISEPFHRYAFVGSFWIQERSPDHSIDRIPPAPVRDLLVTNHSSLNSREIVSLNWTAVGDNMDHGTVAAYELRITNLQRGTSFKKWHRIMSNHVLNGSLDPLPSGTTQNVTFEVPTEMLKHHKSRNFYIALRSHDHSNNPSEVSNIEFLELKTESFVTNRNILELSTETTVTHLVGNKVEEKQDQSTENEFLQKEVSTTDEMKETNVPTLYTNPVQTERETTSTVLPGEGTSIKKLESKVNLETKPPPTTTTTTTTTIHVMTLKKTTPTIPLKTDFFYKFLNTNLQNKNRSSTSVEIKVTPGTTNYTVLTTTELYNATNKEGFDLYMINDGKNSSFLLKTPEKTLEAESSQKVRFAYVNMRVSTIIASWVAGMATTFFIMAIIAAYMKNRKKTGSTYNVPEAEEEYMESVALKDAAL